MSTAFECGVSAMANDATGSARGVFDGVPTFFRALCHTAAQGGTDSYESVGWNLASSAGGLAPHDLDLDEWAEEIANLQKLAAQEDRRGIWDWFASHYPRAMAMIPARRRDRFTEGVLRAWEEGRIAA